MFDDNNVLDRFLGWIEDVAGTFVAMMVCMLIAFMIVFLAGLLAGLIIKSLKVLLCAA